MVKTMAKKTDKQKSGGNLVVFDGSGKPKESDHPDLSAPLSIFFHKMDWLLWAGRESDDDLADCFDVITDVYDKFKAEMVEHYGDSILPEAEA